MCQPSECEKIIANKATDKELISKIYKQLLQLNSRKLNDPIKKWTKELNRHFSKEDIQMANKYIHEKMVNITHYQRNANQNHNEVPFHTSQSGCNLKSISNKCWRGCGEKGTLLHCWWECKLIQPLWRTVWRFLKKLQIELPYDPQSHCWAYTPRKPELKETCLPQCSLQHCF